MDQQGRVLVLLEQLEQRHAAHDDAGCIAVCGELLGLLDRSKTRELWAAIQGTLADCLRNDRTEAETSRERAIHHYEQALSARTEADDGNLWAGNHGNLANLFMARRLGIRADNLRLAAEHYRAALRVFDQQPGTPDWAATHASLAEAFAELGNAPTDVIRHADLALTVIRKAPDPSRWLKLTVVLGEALATQGPEGLTRAVACLQEAVSVHPAHRHAPYGYLNEKIGHCCRDAPVGKTPQGMEQAIRAFEAALAAYQAGGVLDGVVRVHAQLGHAYAHRLQGVRAANVQRAIEHLEAVVDLSKPADPALGYVNAALARLYEDPSLQ
jgi:tetratricopeptide (TPR) repeat protein